MQNIQFKSALKKNYSVLEQAFRLTYGYDYDDFRDWDYVHSAAFTKKVFDKLSKYMYVSQKCGTAKMKECWADKTYALNGKYDKGFANNGAWTGGAEAFGFVLNDGTFVVLDICYSNTLKDSWGIEKNLISTAGEPLGASLCVIVDVNGAKKPNTEGKDIYGFVLTEKGIVPAGSDNNSKLCADLSSDVSLDCTSKMLK